MLIKPTGSRRSIAATPGRLNASWVTFFIFGVTAQSRWWSPAPAGAQTTENAPGEWVTDGVVWRKRSRHLEGPGLGGRPGSLVLTG